MKECFSLWFCYFFFVSSIAFSATDQTIDDRKAKEVPVSFLKVDDPNLGLTEILNGDYSFESRKSWLIDDLNSTYWIRLDFINELDTLETQGIWRLRTTYLFGNATLYYNNKGTLSQKYFGKFDKKEEEKTSLYYSQGVLFEKQNLIADRYLYLKIRMHYANPTTPRFRYLSNKSNRFYTQYYTREDINKITPSQLYLGACLIFFVTFLVIFFYIKKFEFLFYALYTFCSALYLVGPYVNIPGYASFYDSKVGYWIIFTSQIFINLFYVLFAMFFLNTRKIYPKLHALMRIIIASLIVMIILTLFMHFLNHYTEYQTVLNVQRIVMTLFGIFSMAYLLAKAKDKLATFIVLGSFIYMVGALAYLFTINKYYMIVGSVLEIVIFSLGLAYKIKLEYEGKLKLQREISLKELSSLRIQMSSHFIFNSLNSIQHLILNNNKLGAIKYLSKFGKLTRNILESSHEATVTLKEEVELLKSYLELESLRFDGAFSYSIEVEPDIDTENIEIPLMIVQPYVENAILHGLIGKKEGEKNLAISFKKEGNHHICEIEDNGIGRNASEAEKSIKKVQKKSRGMKITEKRLAMLTRRRSDRNTVEIVDKYDQVGKPTGTKVIIRIHETLKDTV